SRPDGRDARRRNCRPPPPPRAPIAADRGRDDERSRRNLQHWTGRLDERPVQPAPSEPRGGTITTASPSSTVFSCTVITVDSVARRFSGTRSTTVARTLSVSPLRTGAFQRRVWLT